MASIFKQAATQSRT
jgi:hypothetical protein